MAKAPKLNFDPVANDCLAASGAGFWPSPLLDHGRGIARSSSERQGFTGAADRLPEPSEHHEIRVKPDARKAAHA